MVDKNKEAFLALVRGGLWETEVHLSHFGKLDFSLVLQLAEEQSVVGLVAAGLEHVVDVKVPKEDVLQVVGKALQLEQRNTAMNVFVSNLIVFLRKNDIYTLLVKGQGVAQCYEKPLWRACGDVDLFLSDSNYDKAKHILKPQATDIKQEYARERHLEMTIDGWVVELHGRLYCGLSSKIDRVLNKVYNNAFLNGEVRSWDNNGVQVFQLKADDDVFYVFTHILQHFYQEGVGLRQVCDWCRLLYKYHDVLDQGKLTTMIRSAGLKTEWMAFGSYAVDFLGMPSEAIPLFSHKARLKRKAEIINEFILSVGNMGHNRDSSYLGKYPYLIRKVISVGRRFNDLARHTRIFPLDSIRFFPYMMYNGLISAIRGE